MCQTNGNVLIYETPIRASKTLIGIDILLLPRERLLGPNLFYFVFKLPLSCDSRWWNNLSLYGWWGIWEEATICIFRGGMSNFWYSEDGFYVVFWKLCLIHVELTGIHYNVWYTQLHFDKFISQGLLTNISNLVSFTSKIFLWLLTILRRSYFNLTPASRPVLW